MTNKPPGRPKGTKVIKCVCGRRVTLLSVPTATCPSCGKAVSSSTSQPARAKSLFLLKPAKKAPKTRKG
jgi:hypothetical protein